MEGSEENHIRAYNSENNGNYWYINTVNNELREVYRILKIVKTDPEITISCVRLTEKLNRSKAEGRIEGKAEGKAIHFLSSLSGKQNRKPDWFQIISLLRFPPKQSLCLSKTGY